MPHPLLEALGGGGKKGPDRLNMPVPRLFRLKSTELPEGDQLRPGSKFKVFITGTVKSIDDDGDIMVNVTNVNDNQPEIKEQETPEIQIRESQVVSP